MEQQLETLSIAEQSSIAEAVLRLVAVAPDIPPGLSPLWSDMDKGESIGIFPIQGAVYLKKDILGGFMAQFPFRILYRSVSDGNGERIESQDALWKIAQWLEQIPYPPLTEGRIIESIEPKSPAFPVGKDESGDLYQCNLNLIYRKEE